MIELKQCLSYTMWISTHMTDGIPGCQDNWTLIRLSLIPTATVVGVDNSTQGTMCCVPLKLVPWVKRTQGPSDGDTLIRDSQVFYHSVRLKQISFWGGMRCIHGSEYFLGVLLLARYVHVSIFFLGFKWTFLCKAGIFLIFPTCEHHTFLPDNIL